MNIPAKTSFQTTSFGVRPREMILCGTAGFLGLALLALPVGSIFLRILIAAGLTGAGVIYAFWRIGRIWTVEEYFFNRWQYVRRTRRYRISGLPAEGEQGASSPEGQPTQTRSEPVGEVVGSAPAAKIPDVPAPERDRPLFWLPERLSPRSNADLLGTVLSMLGVVVFLAWILTTDGVKDIQAHLQMLWSALWNL